MDHDDIKMLLREVLDAHNHDLTLYIKRKDKASMFATIMAANLITGGLYLVASHFLKPISDELRFHLVQNVKFTRNDKKDEE